MRELSEQFSKTYDDLWNRTIKFKNGLSAPGKRVEAMDDSLRQKAEAAYRRGDWEAEIRFKNHRQALRDQLPDDVVTELRRLDRLYVDFKVLQRASSYVGAAQRGGVAAPGQLLNAAVARRQGQAAQGHAPMQQAAQQGGQVLGNLSGKSPGVLGKTALLPVGAVASLIPMKWMAGQSQREIAELLDRTPQSKYLADALRKAKRRVGPYVRASSIGAAVEE